MTRSFWFYLYQQAQVLLNDTATKLILTAVILAALPENQSDGLKNLFAALPILPFLLFAPQIGWLCDRYSKRNIMILLTAIQAVVLLMAALATGRGWITGMVISLFLLGLQGAIFSAAKQSVLRELVVPARLGLAVSLGELAGIACILGGTVAGARVFDALYAQNHKLAWESGMIAIWPFAFLSMVAFLFGLGIQETPVVRSQNPSAQKFQWHWVIFKEVWANRETRPGIIGNAFFFSFGGAIYLTLLESAQLLIGKGPGVATKTSTFLGALGLGFIVGALIVGWLQRNRTRLGFVALGFAGLILGCFFSGVLAANTEGFVWTQAFIGFSGAFFMVPLNAHLQHSAHAGRSGQTLSVNNFMMNLAGIMAVGFQYVLAQKLHLRPNTQFFVYVFPAATVGLVVLQKLGMFSWDYWRAHFLRFVCRIPVHGSWAPGLWVTPPLPGCSVLWLRLASPRPFAVVLSPNACLDWEAQSILTLFGIPQVKASNLDQLRLLLQQDHALLWWPEATVPHSQFLPQLGTLGLATARQLQLPVVPLWMDSQWSKLFGFPVRGFWAGLGQIARRTVSIFVAPPQSWETASVGTVREALLDLSAEALEARPELESHLGYEAMRALRRHAFRSVLLDAGQGERILTGLKLLGVSLALSRWIRRNLPETRIGIVLPAGAGTALANLAVVLAGKVPVNFNFTAGRSANEIALLRSGVTCLISADAMKSKVKDFPWTENTHNLPTVIQSIPKIQMLQWLALGFLLPAFVLRRLLKLPLKGDRNEATLLFTSGSAGEPKGVVLTHRNILANVAQIEGALDRSVIDSMLGCLPTFHSFGCTVTLWWPLLGGPATVTYPSPLETAKLAELIHKYDIALLLNTPTFLRAFLRKAKPEQLAPLKMVVTGAEKTPLDLHEKFAATFTAPLCEGYGMTEATPVVAVNRLDLHPAKPGSLPQPYFKRGSVGPLLAGLSARIRHPETEQDLPIGESGLLWLKGANVFGGYLNDPERTAKVLKDGWYCTGDFGHLDDDGFLFIDGRLSRFSKIAGEMVPHGVVEQKLNVAYGLTEAEVPQLAVTGVPDPDKGEALVLLSVPALDPADVRAKLLAAGLPVLWIPKRVLLVPAIPITSTGKVDLRGCETLARQAP